MSKHSKIVDGIKKSFKERKCHYVVYHEIEIPLTKEMLDFYSLKSGQEISDSQYIKIFVAAMKEIKTRLGKL